ncbi:MAG: diguanylate cyclase domain-containing protein [bacterium]
MYSKQVFRSRYNAELNRKRSNDIFTVIVFTLDLDRMNENLGPTAAMEIFQSLGTLIKKSLGAFGFSTRHGRNKMVTVFPHAEINETEQLLDDFARGLQEQKIHRIQVDSSSEECF